MLRYILAACLVAIVQSACPVRPSNEHSTSPRTPGDGGYQILMSGKDSTYIANAVYTISLQGSRTHERLQQFTRFTLSLDSQHSPKSSNARVGFFQLFSDSLTSFNEDCVNTISEATDYPKSEIQVMWKAPPAGSGCVIFSAMVLENRDRWFAEDGGLTKTVCETSASEIETAEERCCACDEAKYSLIMEGIWSNITHPKDFPFSAWLTHFSDLIGASHESNFSFWGRDHIATDGFRQLAEWGSASGVEAELREKARHLKTLIKAAGLWYPDVNTNTTTNFKVDRNHPLVSVASMLGPSPDWVVGISKLNLCQKDCSWAKSMIIDLYPWDAGTDNGISYMSPNSETNPREKMKPITTSYPEDPRSPFYDPTGKPMLPLARMYLTREEIIPRSCSEDALRQQIAALEVAENTEQIPRPECQTTEYTPWSQCSVTCGKGLRMRTRQYRIPQKAAMMNCNRQLISKEMCVAALPECPGEEESRGLQIDNDAVCETTEWGPWSECSATCGIGIKMRTRRFRDRLSRKKCPHISLVEKEKCMEPPCAPGTEELPDPICKVTDWSVWSPCSATCGKGVKLRTRLLMVEPSLQEECSGRVELLQQRPCLEQADCTFDMATAKVVCMEEADPGPCRGYFQRWAFDSRKLMCVPFAYGGCRGNRNNFLTTDECTNTCSVVRAALTGQPLLRGPNFGEQPSRALILPPVDCMVTDWSPWSPCSVTCGTGRVTSFRMIKRQAENGGQSCPRKLQRKARCQLAPCN
ncbi:spondin-1 [Orussus abietinus]|uniref:spondin-1 n=1 Tax=Orussus abietinus TaxID=222816 RepID=UPI000625D439|nr:spondin-1 [Orussus abietinus]XP_012289135.1 spondin-1 [Orussus abietinus]XP_012289144.1 spondin-1 [Orussus abietinus]XP_012289153.1 spondin-1 [Orussus abietinus]